MKKILAIAVAVMMVMALTVSVFAEEVIYSLGENDTLGQHLETVTIGGGGVLPADDPDGVGSRIATNWVNGSTFDAILAAITTDGAPSRPSAIRAATEPSPSSTSPTSPKLTAKTSLSSLAQTSLPLLPTL